LYWREGGGRRGKNAEILQSVPTILASIVVLKLNIKNMAF